jgi:hypothetical protein
MILTTKFGRKTYRTAVTPLTDSENSLCFLLQVEDEGLIMAQHDAKKDKWYHVGIEKLPGKLIQAVLKQLENSNVQFLLDNLISIDQIRNSNVDLSFAF